MARHSEVLIQGTEVPGLRIIVTVPVDHTWAAETARSMYGFGGNTQYIWRKSWDTNQPAPRRSGGSSSSSSGGGGCLAVLGLIALVIVGGVAGGGGDTTPSETPQYTPQERVQTYVPPTPTPSYANPSGPCVTANFEPC